MLVRSAVEAGKRIEEIIKLVEHDLDLVTSEGAIIQTNQFLMSKSSPFLKNILTEMSSPVRLHLPEISAVALRHLINILQKGYSTGQGSGDSIVKEMKIAAKVLGFEKFPALVFIVGRNPPENISCDNVQQFPQREVEADRIEDGDIEVLADQLLEDQTQDLEEREPSGLNSAGPLLVSNIQNILQDIESDTNEGTSQEPAADETNEASSSKETPKIIFSTGNNKNKDGKKMLRVRRIETLLNPVQNPKPAAHYQGVLSKKRCQVKFTDIANNNFEESSSGALLADHSHNSINKTCGMDMNSNNETPIVPLSPSHGNKRKISRIQSKNITDMENPMTRDIRHKEKMSMSSNPASVQPMSIKQEYDIVEQTPGNPGSVNISSVLDNNLCSVQMINSVNPEMRNKLGKIGTGSKCVQFFYENQNDSPAFPPVYVNTTDEVRAVAALVAEKAGDFKRRGGGNRGEIPQYYTEAAKAKYILEKVVIKHIEQCFTKKGMREFKVGVKKRNYPKRSTIIKINALGEKQTPDGATIKVERLDHQEPPEEDEDDQASICEGPPNDADHMQQIESIVFGSRMPKAKSIKFNSEKATVGDTGKGSKRGGKNKLDYKNPSSPMMMGVVNDLLQRSKSMEAQRTDHELERAEEEAVDDVDQGDADAVDVAVKKPLKVSTSFLRKKRSIGNAVLSPEKSKSKSAKTDDSDGEDMDNILSGSGDQLNVGQKESEDIEKESDEVAGEEKTKAVLKVYAKKKNSNDKASTEVNKETEENDDNLLEQRKQLKCGNMVAFAPDVLDEVNDSKEGIKKIDNLPENLTKEASQNVKKSYRVMHPNKSWKEMNEEAQNSNEKEMAEMVRSVSRGSRPSSQASLSDSRPGSRVEEFSRPSSQSESSPTRRQSHARRVFGEHLGQTEEPHPDSPVMGTRHKRIIEEKETVKPSAKPKAKDKFSMEALKEFENTFVRKGAADKVKFLMKKKEKKAMKKKNKNSRYRGFGETSDPKEDEKPKKPKEVKEKVKKVTVEDPVTEVMKHRKDKISLEEKNLMNELLQFADSAVTPSTSGANKTLQSPSSGASTSQVKEKAKIFVDFEEAQTLTSDNAIGDEDFLVDLI